MSRSDSLPDEDRPPPAGSDPAAQGPGQRATRRQALSVATAPASITAGQPVLVTATLNDTRYNNSNGTEPTQNIAAGQVFVDTPPWGASPSPAAMAPSDGTFNSAAEGATATVSTAGWSTGRHIVFVRGQDAAGNWGPVAAAFVDVAIPVELESFSIE